MSSSFLGPLCVRGQTQHSSMRGDCCPLPLGGKVPDVHQTPLMEEIKEAPFLSLRNQRGELASGRVGGPSFVQLLGRSLDWSSTGSRRTERSCQDIGCATQE